jgi:hypothetical protein
MIDQMYKFFRQRVEVRANGISYTGLFLGADDEYLYMIGPMSYLTIPMELVTSVRAEEASEAERIHKEIEGAPSRVTAQADDKRRYPKDALGNVAAEAPADWPAADPEPDDEPTAEE